MKKYMTDVSELTRIANAIREKNGYKNLYDPVSGIAYVEPDTQYTISEDITFNGTTFQVGVYIQFRANGTWITGYYKVETLPIPSAGTVKHYTYTFTTRSDAVYVMVNPNGSTASNVQLEKGDTETTYEAFHPIEFPDGFVDGIYDI